MSTTIRDMAEDTKYGRMAPSMKVTGGLIRQTEGADSSMRTETSMMDSGETTKLTDSVSTLTQMAQSTRDTGWTTSSTDRAKKSGQMARSTKEITSLVRKMDLESSCGPTGLCTKVSLWTTTFMAMASTNGLTVENSPATGCAIKCKVEVYSRGTMEGVTRVTTTTTRSMATECSPGLMVGSMTARGRMANKMALVYTTT